LLSGRISKPKTPTAASSGIVAGRRDHDSLNTRDHGVQRQAGQIEAAERHDGPATSFWGYPSGPMTEFMRDHDLDLVGV
jgi:hypothetical protein